MKYTPGPWHSCAYRVGRVDGARVADTWSSAIPHHEQVANARLIAAAPELLGALRIAALRFDYLNAGGIEELNGVSTVAGAEECRAAIAKAEDEA